MTSIIASLSPLTTVRNAGPAVVPTCVGPPEGGRSFPFPRRLRRTRREADDIYGTGGPRSMVSTTGKGEIRSSPNVLIF